MLYSLAITAARMVTLEISKTRTMRRQKAITTREDVLLSKLQDMSEADFTELALIPLFKSMGYRVDYHGGPAEGGKDLICRKGGDFGFQEVSVIQVKKTTASAAAGKSNSFAGIVYQLQQAAEKKVPSLTGIAQVPTYVYFITPYEIDTRALESRFEGVASLAPRGVRILDGRIVVNELIRLLPDIAEKICGQSFAMETRLLSNISNADLLSALNYSNEKRIADFYCDLDFGVGKITTKSLFSTEFSPITVSYAIPKSRWPNFEGIAGAVESFAGAEVFRPTIVEVKAQFESEYAKWQSPANQALIKNIERSRSEVQDLLAGFFEKGSQILSDALTEEVSLENLRQAKSAKLINELTLEQSQRLHRIRETNISLSERLEVLGGAHQLTLQGYDDLGSLIHSCDSHTKEFLVEITILKSTAKARLNGLMKDVALMRDIYKRLGSQLSKRVVEPDYEVEVNGVRLVEAIEREKKWVAEGIRALSNRRRKPDSIREFFLRCQRFFELLERLLGERYFFDAVGQRLHQSHTLDPAQRISMPLRDVFATGIHCAVFGEAGAGKSTTLHQYAGYASGRDTENELTLFLPLTRILTEKLLPTDAATMTPVQKLESCLCQFLGADKRYSPVEMINFIKSKRRVTFIFDGVDEVVKRAPWVIDAISDVERIYSNSQIILSSRMSGSYTDDIRYLGLTLLPFTDDQVSHFVDGWFAADPDSALAVKEHLEAASELQEIVRSPLLTTILCVLAENKVPLPEGELSMYAERFKLLFGHYDIHKKTKRVESHHTLLESIARKLAYYLHTRNARSASISDLEAAAIRVTAKRGRVDEASVRRAVQELVDPCNVLIPMTSDGDFGFGHLRYQEYLSATELCANRGIDLASLLASPWWRSVLVLFSKMTDDVNYIIEDVLEKGLNVTKCRDNLLAIVATRKKSEQRQLQDIIEGHVRLDKWDVALHDYDDGTVDDWRSGGY